LTGRERVVARHVQAYAVGRHRRRFIRRVNRERHAEASGLYARSAGNRDRGGMDTDRQAVVGADGKGRVFAGRNAW